MELSTTLLDQFSELTNKSNDQEIPTTFLYGTISVDGTTTTVKLDGSDMQTPVVKGMDAENGDRVMVTLKNHSVTIVSNLTSPAKTGTYVDAAILRISSLEAVSVTTTYLEANYATITNLNAAVARIDTLEANAITVSYLNANYATITDLTATNARIDNIVASTVTTEYLIANYATITLSNIEAGTIKTAMIDTGAINTAQIADGSITDAKIVELTANKIHAGTLSVERLELVGSTSSIVYALNNSGDLVSTVVDTLDGDILTPRSITADKIVANAITANEIASLTITANEIASNAITADKISVTDLYALGATIGGFTIGTSSIYNGTSSAISTTPGVYIGIDAIRSYNSPDAYVQIENGILSANGALIKNGVFQVTSTDASDSSYITLQNIANRASVECSGFTSICLDPNNVYKDWMGTLSYMGITVQTSSSGTPAYSSGIIWSGFYIKLNGVNTSYVAYDSSYFNGTATVGSHLSVGGYSNASYGISTNSLICNSWIRTVGNTGWYNETYGGGWYMSDSTYIRNFGSKHVLLNGHLYFANGTTYYVSNAGNARFASIDLVGSMTIASPMYINSTLHVTGRIYDSVDTYNATTSSAANLYINSSGHFYRSTSSSMRYKEDITDLSIDKIKSLYSLKVHNFKYKDEYMDASDERYKKDIPGFIAEEVDDVLSIAVDHIDGQVEMWNNQIMVPCLLRLIQDVNQRVSVLESITQKVYDMEFKMMDLELEIKQLKTKVA